MEVDKMTPEEEQKMKDLGRWDLLDQVNTVDFDVPNITRRMDIIGQNGNDGEHYNHDKTLDSVAPTERSESSRTSFNKSKEVVSDNSAIKDNISRAAITVGGVYDAGIHYRKEYKGVKLDPFRIAKIYGIDGVQLTILKKVLATGNRGYKDNTQDYKDIINACSRALEMIEEDKEHGD